MPRATSEPGAMTMEGGLIVVLMEIQWKGQGNPAGRVWEKREVITFTRDRGLE